MKIKIFFEKTKRNENLAWFLGVSIGDGYTTYGRYGVDTTTPEIINLLIGNLAKLTKKSIKAEIYGNPDKFNLKGVIPLYYQKRKEIHSNHIKIKVDSVEFSREMSKLHNEVLENVNNFPENGICSLRHA